MRTVHGEVYPIGSAIYSNNRPISHNQGYKSNKNQINDASSNFYFQERLGQINWREVNRLDVDKIIKDVDLNAIQVIYLHLYYIEAIKKCSFCQIR